jgi:hypothetical protein
LLSVRFLAADFNRTTEWVFEPTRAAFVKVDVSSLRGVVVVKLDGSEAGLCPFVVRRNHQRGGALSAEIALDTKSPERRMRLSNL